jgi:hypothetical protein
VAAKTAGGALKRERSELKAIVGHWKTLWGFLAGAFTFLPLEAALLEPLLPGVLGVIAPTLAVLLSILVMLATYYLFRDSGK